MTKIWISRTMQNLEHMEKIVEAHPELSWSGWDIVRLYKDQSAYLNKDGIFKDGVWYIKEVYKLEKDGWNIPSKIIRNYIV